MKKTAIILALCFLFSACSNDAPSSQNPSSLKTVETQEAWGLSGKIIECIAQRQIVPDSYIYLLKDEGLKADIEQYNTNTFQLNNRFTRFAIDIIADFYGWDWYDENGVRKYSSYTLMELPERYIDMAGRIAHYALYRNADEMIYADDTIWPMLILELGGSAGAWPRFLHGGNDILSLGWGDDPMEEYFTLTESIISRLEQEKIPFYVKCCRHLYSENSNDILVKTAGFPKSQAKRLPVSFA